MSPLRAVALSVVLVVAVVGDAQALSDFRTPNRAAYCALSDGRATPSLSCWTPNDGFTVWMTRRGRAHKEYDEQARGFYDQTLRVLRFGETWRNRTLGYRCRSRRSGLTCRNRRGHGWWLGRFVGYRLFLRKRPVDYSPAAPVQPSSSDTRSPCTGAARIAYGPPSPYGEYCCASHHAARE